MASVCPTGPYPTIATSKHFPIGPSAARVGHGHELGQVVGSEKRRRHRRTPAIEALHAVLPDPRLPELIVDDRIHVRVVLREVSGRIAEIPEEVRSDVV